MKPPVAIAGGGPVGLTLALALARYGVSAVVLESDGTVSDGSRALGMSRRTLDIWASLGFGEAVENKGRPWFGGWTYYREKLVLEYRIPHEAALRHPPMLNLQQCDAERYLVEQTERTPSIDLRWRNRVTGVHDTADGVTVTVDADGTNATLQCQYLVACDGARSTVRSALGLRMEGVAGQAHYLIVDVQIDAPMEIGRRAWFDPPYSPGTTVLMHGQPDNIWRIDWQIAPDEDREGITGVESVARRVAAHLDMIGVTAAWRVVWVSTYQAHARTLTDYCAGRIMFAGDAAHHIPIFGIRGLNSGVEDAWNLAWKLALVIEGRAPSSLLTTYSTERVGAARENLRLANRALRFMTPPTRGWRLMRDAVLSIGVTHDAVRDLINPRQATLVALRDSPLSSYPDRGDELAGGKLPGDVLPNVRVEQRTRQGWTAASLYDVLGTGFVLLIIDEVETPPQVAGARVVTATAHEGRTADVLDRDGALSALLAASPSAVYLVRPDNHIAARWRVFHPDEVALALDIATGQRLEAADAAFGAVA